MSHFVHLVRHGEQRDAEQGVLDAPLSERGREQARRLGERLRGIRFDRVLTSPLDRARETATVLDGIIDGPPSEESTLLFDCYPSGPVEGAPGCFDRFFAGVPDADAEAGAAQMADAADAFLGRTRGDEHSLLVTHNFVVGALIRSALELPEWRWLGFNSLNCALAILRIRSAKPAELLAFNDVGHLPPQLRTGGAYAGLGS